MSLIPYLRKHKRCCNEYTCYRLVFGVTVCSDSRDRKMSCYNTIDGQITRPICSKDKVPVLIAIGSEGCKVIKVFTITSDLIGNSVLC